MAHIEAVLKEFSVSCFENLRNKDSNCITKSVFAKLTKYNKSQKNSQIDKYSKDFLSKIFTAKKNVYTKIAVTFTVSKGHALRVFATISTPRFTSGSILPKNLDSRHFSGCLKSISFFFFFSFFFFSLSGG